MRDPLSVQYGDGGHSVILHGRSGAATAAHIVRMTGVAVVPCGTEDDLAEVQALVRRIAKLEHVGLDVAEGRLGLLDRSFRKGIDDALSERLLTRMCSHDLNPLFVAELMVGHPKHVH